MVERWPSCVQPPTQRSATPPDSGERAVDEYAHLNEVLKSVSLPLSLAQRILAALCSPGTRRVAYFSPEEIQEFMALAAELRAIVERK